MSAISRFFFPYSKSNTVIVRSSSSSYTSSHYPSSSSRYDPYNDGPLSSSSSSASASSSTLSLTQSSSRPRLPSLSPNGSLLLSASNDPSSSISPVRLDSSALLELNDTTCACLQYWNSTSQHLHHHDGQLQLITSFHHPIFHHSSSNLAIHDEDHVPSPPSPSHRGIYASLSPSGSPSSSLILPNSTSSSSTNRNLKCDICGHSIYDIGLQGLFLCNDYPRCKFLMCIVCNFREHAPLSITLPNHHIHRLYRYCDTYTRVHDNRRHCNLCGRLVGITLTNMIWSCVEDDIDVCTDCFAALDLYRSPLPSSSSSSPMDGRGRRRRDTVNYSSHKCSLYRYELFDYVFQEQKRMERHRVGSNDNDDTTDDYAYNPDLSSTTTLSISLCCKGCRTSLPAILRATQNITDETVLPIASSVYACKACHYAVCGTCITSYIGNWSLPSYLSPHNRKPSSNNNSTTTNSHHHHSSRTLSPIRSLQSMNNSLSASSVSSTHRSRTLSPLARTVQNSLSSGSEMYAASVTASQTTDTVNSSSESTKLTTELKENQETINQLRSELKAVRKQLKQVLTGKELQNSRNEVHQLRSQLNEYKTLSLLMNDVANVPKNDPTPSNNNEPSDNHESTTPTTIASSVPTLSLTTHQYLETMTDETITDIMKKMEHSLTLLKNEYQRRQLCIICCDQSHNVFFLPCTHVCVCFNCSSKLTTCPICRETIQERLEIPKEKI